MLVRHLLDMRTGLLRQGFNPSPESILNRSYLHPYHTNVIINEYPLAHKPGERYDYSNATSEMVAPLIERATGVRYGAWVSEQVLKPLGAKGGEVWLNRSGGTAHSGCCIMLPADSFMRLGLLSYYYGVWEGTRLLPVGYVAESRIVTPQHPHTGMGLYVADSYVKHRGAVSIPEQKGSIHRRNSPQFSGTGTALARVVPIELTRAKAHWPQASIVAVGLLRDQVLVLRL